MNIRPPGRSAQSQAMQIAALLRALSATTAYDAQIENEPQRFRLTLRNLFPALGDNEYPVQRRRNRRRKALRAEAKKRAAITAKRDRIYLAKRALLTVR